MISTTVCGAAAENDLASPASWDVPPDIAASVDTKPPKRWILRLVSKMAFLKPIKSITTTDHTSDQSIQGSGQAKERVDGFHPGNEDNNECATTMNDSDCNIWQSIPEYSKFDLLLEKHLGKGTFSDVFEVVATVAAKKKSLDPLDKDDLDKLIEAKFAPLSDDNAKTAKNAPEKEDKDEPIFQPARKVMAGDDSAKDSPRPGEVKTANCHNRRQTRALQHGVAASLYVRKTNQPVHTRQVTYAMKCLRPCVRSDPKQFAIGIEDLFHETVILASLDHPNIVKIHGRASGGRVSASSGLGDGYFTLLDRLEDTLEDRIVCWGETRDAKVSPSISLIQIKAACSVAGALAYLHSKNIVLRDLKPANAGFDSAGVLTLFDFGFAVRLDGIEPSGNPSQAEDDAGRGDPRLLHGECGTLRYMAPEVGLSAGYGMPADVYSFVILLWELCALERPFVRIKSEGEFRKSVFDNGTRPQLSKHWPRALKDTMSNCWSNCQEERPAMEFVKMSLGAGLLALGYKRMRLPC